MIDSPTRYMVSALGLLAALSLPADASGRPDRVDEVPKNEWSCGLCHVGGLGGAARNAFGQQIEQRLGSPEKDAEVPWQAIYKLDADLDGYTNGEELGDPNGTWQVGDSPVGGPVSHPSKAGDTPCGNGTIEGPEECDGSNLNDASCTTLGYSGGTLACDSDCNFDTSGCGSGPTDAGMDARSPRTDADAGAPGPDSEADGSVDADARVPDVARTDGGLDADVEDASSLADGGTSNPADGGPGRETSVVSPSEDTNASGADAANRTDGSESDEGRTESSSEGRSKGQTLPKQEGCGCSSSGGISPSSGLVIILTLIGTCLTLLYRRFVSGTSEESDES